MIYPANDILLRARILRAAARSTSRASGELLLEAQRLVAEAKRQLLAAAALGAGTEPD